MKNMVRDAFSVSIYIVIGILTLPLIMYAITQALSYRLHRLVLSVPFVFLAISKSERIGNEILR